MVRLINENRDQPINLATRIMATQISKDLVLQEFLRSLLKRTMAKIKQEQGKKGEKSIPSGRIIDTYAKNIQEEFETMLKNVGQYDREIKEVVLGHLQYDALAHLIINETIYYILDTSEEFAGKQMTKEEAFQMLFTTA